MTPGERHRLAVRVARAARLAGSPIGYYNAYAEIRELEERGVTGLYSYFRSFYGSTAWDAPTPDPIVERRA